MTDLESIANEIELRGGSGEVADFLRRIELERADAARKALEEAACKVEVQEGGQTYRKAYKSAAAVIRLQLAKWV